MTPSETDFSRQRDPVLVLVLVLVLVGEAQQNLCTGRCVWSDGDVEADGKGPDIYRDQHISMKSFISHLKKTKTKKNKNPPGCGPRESGHLTSSRTFNPNIPLHQKQEEEKKKKEKQTNKNFQLEI